MIVPKKTQKNIRGIVGKHWNAFIFKIAGKTNLTVAQVEDLVRQGLIEEGEDHGLITEAYYIGRARNHIHPRKRPGLLVSELKELADKGYVNEVDAVTLWQHIRKEGKKKMVGRMTDSDKYAIKHIQESAGNYITALKQKMETAVTSSIQTANLEYRNKVLTEQIRPVIAEGIAKEETIQQIAADLRDTVGDYARDWKRVAMTETTNAMNLGEADAIVDRHPGKRADEIYVFKIVNQDSALCPSCRSAYTTDGMTPRIFTMKELAGNGSNMGRPQKSWQPIIGSHHPWCRCTLNNLPKGWGFEEGSNEMTFIGTKHNEYDEQRKPKK